MKIPYSVFRKHHSVEPFNYEPFKSAQTQQSNTAHSFIHCLKYFSSVPFDHVRGTSSSVSIATGYGLGGPGIESRWSRGFPLLFMPAFETTQPSVNGYRAFPAYKERPGRDLDLSPLLVPWSWKSRAIPLLPLRAVRPVQSLSACTVELYLYSPYGPYDLYRASVPVQGRPYPLLYFRPWSGRKHK
jgi:hypothetical protein